MDDLVRAGVCMAAIGTLLGFLPTAALAGVSIGVGMVLYGVVSKENDLAPPGTSGAMGLTFMVILGYLAVFVPSWITLLIRHL